MPAVKLHVFSVYYNVASAPRAQRSTAFVGETQDFEGF